VEDIFKIGINHFYKGDIFLNNYTVITGDILFLINADGKPYEKDKAYL